MNSRCKLCSKYTLFNCPENPFLIGLIVLLSAVFWAYWKSFQVPFQYDDYAAIVNNKAVHDLGNLWKVLAHGHPPRPVLSLSLALNYYWGGLNPYGYHWVNLILHAGSGLWVQMIIYTLAVRASWQSKAAQQLAWLTAILFLLHPLQTESVSYIWGRSGLLCGFFYLGSCALYLHTGFARRFATVMAVVLFALAIGSKAIALSLPFVLWWVERYLPADQTRGSQCREYLYRLAPFGALVALRLSLYYLPGKMGGGNGASISAVLRLARPWPEGLNIWTNFLTQAEVFFVYLKLLIWPLGLNVDHDFAIVRSVQDSMVIIALLGLGLFLVLAWVLRQRAPLWSFALVWFVATLAFFFLLPLRDPLVERRLYLPVLGFCLFIALLLMRLVRYLGAHWQRLGRAVWLPALILIILYAGLTRQRNNVWLSSEALWQDSAAKSPYKPRPHGNLAVATLRKGNPQQAINIAYAVIGMDSGYGQGWTTLLDATLATANDTKVQLVFNEALENVPAHALSWYFRRTEYLPQQSWRQLFLDKQNSLAEQGAADILVALAIFHLQTPENLEQALKLLDSAWPRRKQLKHFRRKPLGRVRKALQQKVAKQQGGL